MNLLRPTVECTVWAEGEFILRTGDEYCDHTSSKSTLSKVELVKIISSFQLVEKNYKFISEYSLFHLVVLKKLLMK